MIPEKKEYDHVPIEDKWYAFWESQGYFHADEKAEKESYSIVIPPPNITGSLHMGHALNNTLQDILIRWKRMQGYNTLWMPGTDHAGIATQNVVERHLQKMGLDRQKMGREEFVRAVWKWREESGRTILLQLKKLGASCDWERERFTLDEGLSEAVKEVFCQLYEAGLIYRGDYIINWCPHCQTALSDLEVEYKPVAGRLYYVEYPLCQGEGGVIVATTRPETILGDTAVAVNPNDGRYRHLVGQWLSLPILGRRIPIVADEYVDPEFGTGAVKVTPAHDLADFEIGVRHGLPSVKVIQEDGTMTEEAGKYRGLSRSTCRERLLHDLQEGGYLRQVEDYSHSVGHCYRCATVIEPMLSRQWFVRMKPLAEPAIAAVREGRIRIIPSHWTKTYFEWMENIRDWCISRQIWWGHRIPVWYCRGCGEVIVSRSDVTRCPRCQGDDLEQESDVLDTWFSSALWPFSTMGWPRRTPELERFYPTSVLVTGFDILFFWVARMIMMGLRFAGDVPFREVFIHALVRDAEGQKMSKSKGNVIDPLVVIEKYGADAFRFTLAALAAQGRDIRLSEERIAGYRHFCNKLWNSARFILLNTQGFDLRSEDPFALKLDLADRWIRSRLEQLIAGVNEALVAYRFNEAAQFLYQFWWHEFCDWYLEIVKARIQAGTDQEGIRTGRYLLLEGLGIFLRLLHPFMPFITEEIWQYLPQRQESIMISPWPQDRPEIIDEAAIRAMEDLREIIRVVRNLRAEMNIPYARETDLWIRTEKEERIFPLGEGEQYIRWLGRVSELKIGPRIEPPSGCLTAVLRGMEVFIPLRGVIDPEEQRIRLQQQIEKVNEELARVSRKLADSNFQARAPAHVVAQERTVEKELKESRDKLLSHLRLIHSLGNSRKPEG
jgi:valyl-tRNA synthetase